MLPFLFSSTTSYERPSTKKVRANLYQYRAASFHSIGHQSSKGKTSRRRDCQMMPYRPRTETLLSTPYARHVSYRQDRNPSTSRSRAERRPVETQRYVVWKGGKSLSLCSFALVFSRLGRVGLGACVSLIQPPITRVEVRAQKERRPPCVWVFFFMTLYRFAAGVWILRVVAAVVKSRRFSAGFVRQSPPFANIRQRGKR
jgi:hypothetical protein